MTGQELIQLGVDRLADGSDSELVRVLRLWELSESQHLPKQVERWRSGQTQTVPWDVAWRVLVALDGINWEALEREPPAEALTPASAERLRVPTAQKKQKVTRVRKRAGGGTP